MRTKNKSIHLTVFITIFVLIVTLITDIVPARTAYAETVDYDKTYVMDDLEESSIGGEPFNISDYTYNEKKSPTVLYLSEYCYSFKQAMQYNYGLYLYVWNPQGLDFVTDSEWNTVEFSYGDTDIIGYDKYPLKCLSVSNEKNYERLFYKFKIELTAEEKTKILDSLKSDERYYHISGMELMLPNEVYPHDYYVNKGFTYSGYAKGYGVNQDQDTLEYTSRFGEVLDIERQGGLRQTFYRPKESNGSNNYTQDTLQTVYFSVPNTYFANGFDIGSIRMEWLKTLTNWGFVTGNNAVYNALKPYVGKITEGRHENYQNVVYSNDNGQPLPTKYGFASLDGGNVSFNTGIEGAGISYLSYLFPADSSGMDSADNFVLPFETIRSWVNAYHDEYDKDYVFYDSYYTPPHIVGQEVQKGGNFIYKTPYNGELLNVGGVNYNYSRALFIPMTNKKTRLDILATDTRSLKSMTIGKKWWDGLFGLDGEYVVSDYSKLFDGIEAIHCVEPKDIKSNKIETCNALYIDANDYDDFKEFYDEATSRLETVVMVRYDVGTYQAVECAEGIRKNGSLVTGWTDGDTNARAFRMSYYLGLDVIHIAFDNGVEQFILPVVSSPIDAASDGTPALTTRSDRFHLEWWHIVLAIAILVLIIVLLYYTGLLPAVMKGIWWLICLPFRGIAALVRLIAERRRQRQLEKAAESRSYKPPKSKSTAKKPGRKSTKRSGRK